MNKPNLYFEKRLWSKGHCFVAGCDEVGRGAFAGPVVAACVAFPNHLTIQQFNNSTIRIDDSKKLSDKQRRISDKWTKDNCLTWGIGEASVSEINKLGL